MHLTEAHRGMKKVDVAFLVTGTRVPADHGYALYGAICRILPFLHAHREDVDSSSADEIWKEVGIQTINGESCKPRQIAINSYSRLRIRIDRDCVESILPLINKTLDLNGGVIRIGTPEIFPLRPASLLRSRLVIIKGFVGAHAFIEAANRQLRDLGINATAAIPYRRGMVGLAESPEQKSPLLRRTLQIGKHEIVGYALEVEGLTADESIRLQENGLGGRRRFGCGIFVPARG